jgi:hypothetical protein
MVMMKLLAQYFELDPKSYSLWIVGIVVPCTFICVEARLICVFIDVESLRVRPDDDGVP